MENDKVQDQPPESRGRCRVLCRMCGDVTVEPLLACFVIPSVLASLATVNLNLEKACRVNLAFNATVCSSLALRNISTFGEQETQMQVMVARMSVWRTIVHSCVPALLILFAGSWSDRRGRRKPFLLLPILGELLSSFGLLLCTYFFLEWPMEVAGVFESLFPSLFGGWMFMFLGTYSYIGAVSSEERRTFRVGVVNVFTYLAIPVGTSLSGVLLHKAGFYGVFGTAAAMYLLGLTYGYFRIEETQDVSQDHVGKGFIRDFFNVSHVKDMVKVATKRREGSRRLQIILVMFLIVVVAGPLYGEVAVFYLFARFRFNWNEVDYSAFSTYCVIVNLIGMSLISVVMSRVLKWNDWLIGAISCTSKLCGSLCFALCDSVTLFYLAAALDMLSGGGNIVLRSAASKLVPVEELGKMNSLFGLCEAVAPLVYGPLYSWIYSVSLESMPGACFLVGFGLTVPAVVLFLCMYQRVGRPQRPSAAVASYVNEAMQMD